MSTLPANWLKSFAVNLAATEAAPLHGVGMAASLALWEDELSLERLKAVQFLRVEVVLLQTLATVSLLFSGPLRQDSLEV